LDGVVEPPSNICALLEQCLRSIYNNNNNNNKYIELLEAMEHALHATIDLKAISP
jgi:hypothetical protein